MPTLNIGGQRVKVDDSFLQMPQDQQNSAVEEIAKSLGSAGGGKKSGGGMFSDVVPEIKAAAGNALDAMGRLGDRGKQGPVEGLMTTGRAALAVPELLASPITGAARSLMGHPIAEAETAVGGLINPEVASQREESGAAYEDAKHSVDTAMSAMAPRGAPPVAAAAAPVATEGGRVVEAASRLSDVTGQNVNVPRAIASDNMAVQRIGQGVRNIPVVGDAIPKATNELVENLGGAVKSVADQHGQGSGPNVAGRVGRSLADQAEAEMRAATEAGRRSDEAVTGAWQRDQDAAHAQVAQRETQSLEQARAAVGDMNPQDMGAALIQRLRTEEGAARANKENLYGRAGAMDASVRADEVGRARAFVAQRLDDSGIVVDPSRAGRQSLTPAAERMMDELQQLSELSIPNKAVGARLPAAGDERAVGVSVNGLEQARKRLVFFRSGASTDADRNAAGAVMRAFDDWQSQAFENALLSGDDAALSAFREARAANASWRSRFFNDENDAGKIINRVVTGEITPQEVANYMIGAGQVGAKGVSSRLLTEIADVTNNDPEVMRTIGGGIWNKLSQATEGAAGKAPAKVASDIMEFLNGSGRDVANRLFTPEQRRLMRSYADTLRTGQDARRLIGEVAETTKPGAMPVQPGPMKQLADAVIGKGRKSDEALFSAIDAYAKSGSRGDISTLAKLVRAIPQEDRGDLAGAIIRNLGVSPRTGQFSPDVFVSQWKTYTPQAKAILFGNAGAQRQAIDDIAIISDRLKQVGSKFGNPSGTAQNVNFAAIVTGLMTAPITTLATAAGGAAAAKILAAPAGAASAAKWSRAYEALARAPSPRTIGLFQVASRNLANTANGLGVKFSPADLLRAIQGPVQSSADEKQQ